MRVSEIRVKRIRVNQGLGVIEQMVDRISVWWNTKRAVLFED